MRNFIILMSLNLIPLMVVNSSENQQVDSTSSKNWKKVAEFTFYDNVMVTKYISKRTGLTVVFMPTKSPIVEGYICLPHELYSNEGFSFGASRLINSGSKKYPYKGFLDMISFRYLGSSIYSIPEIDHSCYYQKTSVDYGFLKMLPVVMDSILFPKLTKADFLIDFYHVDGEGNEGGVSYNLMKGFEAYQSSVIEQGQRINAYPGKNPYSYSETGIPEVIRQATHEKFQEYFKKVHRSENLYLTIGGQINHTDFFRTLESLEQVILKQKTKETYTKPFRTDFDQIIEDKTVTTNFPSENMKFGTAALILRLKGKLWNQIETIFALQLVGNYLTSTNVSPLMKKLALPKNSSMSNIKMTIYKFSEPAIKITFSGVYTHKLTDVKQLFQEAMEDVINEKDTKFDLKRMAGLIKEQISSTRLELLNNPIKKLLEHTKLDMIYGGNDNDDLQSYCKEGTNEIADKFLEYSSNDWINLINSTFSLPNVMVLSYPSNTILSDIKEKDKLRIGKRITAMGTDWLQEKKRELAEAKASQIKPPTELVKTFDPSDVNDIKLRSMTYYNHTSTDQPLGFDLTTIPFRFNLYDIDSEINYFHIFFDTSALPSEDRMYLVLLTNIWLKSPLLINGVEKPLEDVIQLKTESVISIENNIGFNNYMSHFEPSYFVEYITFSAKFFTQNYETSIEFLKNTLLNVQFKEEIIKTTVSTLLQKISSWKKEAWREYTDMRLIFDYKDNNNMYYASIFRQNKFLKKIQAQLKNDSESVIEKIKEIKTLLVNPQNINIHMASNIKSIIGGYPNSTQPWNEFFPKDLVFPNSQKLSTPIFPLLKKELLRNITNLNQKHVIKENNATTFSWFSQSIRFDETIKSKEYAIAKIFTRLISQEIKRNNLGGNTGLNVYANEGTISVHVYGTIDLYESYNKFRKIVSDFTNETMWDPVELVSAKGEWIFYDAKEENEFDGLVDVSVKAALNPEKLDPLFNRKLLKTLSEVTLEEVQSAAKKYLPLFFDPSKTTTIIVCNDKNMQKIMQLFAKHNIELTEIGDVEKWDLL